MVQEEGGGGGLAVARDGVGDGRAHEVVPVLHDCRQLLDSLVVELFVFTRRRGGVDDGREAWGAAHGLAVAAPACSAHVFRSTMH